MKKIIISVVIFFLLLVISFCWWVLNDMQRQLRQPLALQTNTILQIEPGVSLTAISNKLVASGWLPHPYYLIIEGRRQQVAGSVKAGEYEISPGTTPLGLLDIIVSGKVIQHSLTILEGWTFQQIIDAVNSSDELVHTLPSSTPEYVMDAIGYAGYIPEGRFFPDTYHFPDGTTDVQFLQRAFKIMAKVLEEEWQHRTSGLPYQSPYQALILASIIEKETAVAEERGKIAGVFVRRLQRRIKLQTDPTVIYAMGKAFKGNIRRKDLAIDSPFNTYVNKGLPPTPIASPGRASITAALQPEDGNTLYFVAKGDGNHHFSKTLTEHNQAVVKYQLKRQ